jgi:hypothetical protein
MTRPVAACVLALGVSLAACGGDPGPSNSSGTITIYNSSTYILDEINVAPVSQRSWGPNLISGTVLLSGEQVTISVPCGTYDVQIWDSNNRNCILGGLDLCFSSQAWTIDNYTLRNCGY